MSSTIIVPLHKNYSYSDKTTSQFYKYGMRAPTLGNSLSTYIPPSIFYLGDSSGYLPSLHGQTNDQLLRYDRVYYTSRSCRPTAFAAAVDHTFLEIQLVNTGYCPLKNGDRFVVTMPSQKEIDAQISSVGSIPLRTSFAASYDQIDTRIWGGVLATRLVNAATPTDELLDALKQDAVATLHSLVSPIDLQATYALLDLISAGKLHSIIPDPIVNIAENITSNNHNNNNIITLLETESVGEYVTEMLHHAHKIFKGLNGYCQGTVVRAVTCPDKDGLIHPGSMFWAKMLN